MIRELDPRDDAALARCFEVFSVLRPHLDLAAFAAGVRAQTAEGYRVHYVESEGRVAAAAGWRVARFLAWGKVLYVDDLVAHPERRRAGHGGALLDWLFARARARLRRRSPRLGLPAQRRPSALPEQGLRALLAPLRCEALLASANARPGDSRRMSAPAGASSTRAASS